MKLLYLAVFTAALIGATAVRADDEALQDCDNCRDHPTLARYPGSVLVGADQVNFDEAAFPVGPVTTNAETDELVKPKTAVYAGKRTRLYYFTPKERSVLEVFTNYRQAVEKAGMTVQWTCAHEECGKAFDSAAIEALKLDLENTLNARIGFSDSQDPRYFVAELKRPQGNLHVAVLAADLSTRGHAGIYVVVLEEKAMDQGMITLDANALDRDILAQGKAVIYGVQFDFDKAVIKPESKPQLDEIARLLTTQPTLKLRITGHTDNQGKDAYNLDLSQRRAQAIVTALVNDYHIAADRLAASGMGANAPIASNDNEQGRAKNRRVELVKQ